MTAVLDKEGLRKIIVQVSGLQDGSVVWGLGPQPFVSDVDRAIVKMKVFSLRGEGWDEKRYEYGPPGYPPNVFVTTMRGNRTLVITFRVEAFDKDVEAAEILDRIRTQIIDDDPNMKLDAIRLAYSDSTQSTEINYTVDEHVVNSCQADFTFLAVAEQVTSVIPDGQVGPDNRGGYIETVNGNNKIIPELSQ